MSTLLTKVKRLQDMVARREVQSPGSRWSGRDLAKRLSQMIAAEEGRLEREKPQPYGTPSRLPFDP